MFKLKAARPTSCSGLACQDFTERILHHRTGQCQTAKTKGNFFSSLSSRRPAVNRRVVDEVDIIQGKSLSVKMPDELEVCSITTSI